MAIFANVFFIKVKYLHQKSRLKASLKENSGVVNLVLNHHKSTHVLVYTADILSCRDLKNIRKYQLLVFCPDFISNSVEKGKLLEIGVHKANKSQDDTSDQRPDRQDVEDLSSAENKNATKKNENTDSSLTVIEDSERRIESKVGTLRFYSENDQDAPFFPDFEVAKYTVLEKVNSKKSRFVVTELQCSQEHYEFPFLYAHFNASNGTKNNKQFVTNTAEEIKHETFIADLSQDFLLRETFPPEAESLASTKLQKACITCNFTLFSVQKRKKSADDYVHIPDSTVYCQRYQAKQLPSSPRLYVSVFKRGHGHPACHAFHMKANLPFSLMERKKFYTEHERALCTVSKAEGILLQVKNALGEGTGKVALQEMRMEFYHVIHHKTEMEYKVSKKLLSRKQDLCQLIDMLNIRETNMSCPKPSSLARYQALRYKIEAVDSASEFLNVEQQVLKTNYNDCSVRLLQVYRVDRISKRAEFLSSLGNISLFHASSVHNFMGILSRGLLVPKMVVEDHGLERADTGNLGHGLERADTGNLGSGIYFSDSVSTSIKYSLLSEMKGTQLLAVCDVALGSCLDFCERDYFNNAPSGYDGVHGVHKTADISSGLRNDEFVVYKTCQVKIRYVVKFCLAEDQIKPFQPAIGVELEQDYSEPELQCHLQHESYALPNANLSNPVKTGFDRLGDPVPLESVYVKPRIIDLVAQDAIKKVCVKQVKPQKNGFSMDMSIEMPSSIERIHSWTYKLKIKKTGCKAVIKTVDIRGFVLDIWISRAYLPWMWVGKHPNKISEACMLVFQAEFETAFEEEQLASEIIILLDCSNSMAGSAPHQAKQIALHVLELFCFRQRVNVVKFGTNFIEFSSFSMNTISDLASLKEFITSATTTSGNTDLWKTLHYLSLLFPSQGQCNVLLIWDGHLQIEVTFQIVKDNVQHTRLFTCGVGSTANQHMLRSLSQYGAGAFEYIDPKSKYNWEVKIQRQVFRIFSPGCRSISIKWQQFNTGAAEPMQAPAQIHYSFLRHKAARTGRVSKDGSWNLSPQLGKILTFDVGHLINNFLIRKGIQSVGPNGKELLQLIATLHVVQFICCPKELKGIVFKTLMKLDDSSNSSGVHWAFELIKKEIEYVRRVERFPPICYLELGKDDSDTKKILGI
ncbi:LOW QUALITY PROTEIN: protein mono-ADP-ribosyltransferase PARP4 [Cariama cristata]